MTRPPSPSTQLFRRRRRIALAAGAILSLIVVFGVDRGNLALGALNVGVTLDLRAIQMLGHAAHAVEIATQHECTTPDEACKTYLSACDWEDPMTRGDETLMLTNLIACALTRLREIR